LQAAGPAPLGIRAAVVYAEDPNVAAQRVNRRGVLRAIATAIALFAVPITTGVVAGNATQRLQAAGPVLLGIRAAVVYAEDPDVAAQRVNRRGVLRAIATAIVVLAALVTL
jgi:hypothetical protein